MLKMMVKALLVLVVTAVAMPFVYQGSDGKPLMSFNDLKMPELGLPDLPGIPDEMPLSITDTMDQLNEIAQRPEMAPLKEALIQYKADNGTAGVLEAQQNPIISQQRKSTTPSSNTAIYKWRGADGVWHFSNGPGSLDADQTDVVERVKLTHTNRLSQ